MAGPNLTCLIRCPQNSPTEDWSRKLHTSGCKILVATNLLQARFVEHVKFPALVKRPMPTVVVSRRRVHYTTSASSSHRLVVQAFSRQIQARPASVVWSVSFHPECQCGPSGASRSSFFSPWESVPVKINPLGPPVKVNGEELHSRRSRAVSVCRLVSIMANLEACPYAT